MINYNTEQTEPDPTEDRLSVVVDDREQESEVINRLQTLDHLDVTVKRLTKGDYEVERRVTFERKTVIDFASSILDGRLFSQAARLASTGRSVAMIIEGSRDDLAATEMRRESLQGAMVSLTLIWQIPVLRSLSPTETADLILFAAQQLHRRSSGIVVRHGRKAKRKEKLQLQILQGLPGIGPDRAKALLERFGSVRAVMTADPEDLSQLPGIGDKTAEAIGSILESDFNAADASPPP